MPSVKVEGKNRLITFIVYGKREQLRWRKDWSRRSEKNTQATRCDSLFLFRFVCRYLDLWGVNNAIICEMSTWPPFTIHHNQVRSPVHGSEASPAKSSLYYISWICSRSLDLGLCSSYSSLRLKITSLWLWSSQQVTREPKGSREEKEQRAIMLFHPIRTKRKARDGTGILMSRPMDQRRK